MKEIKELCTWDVQCISEPDGFYDKSIPDVTRHNMEIYMNKMNEIISEIIKKI